jgi:hypothetical protein
VRAAQALASFPTLVESMTAGRMSYSHLRAISRIATPGETQLVDDLIMVAQHGTVAHLEVIICGLQTRRRHHHSRHRGTTRARLKLTDRPSPTAAVGLAGPRKGRGHRLRVEGVYLSAALRSRASTLGNRRT